MPAIRFISSLLFLQFLFGQVHAQTIDSLLNIKSAAKNDPSKTNTLGLLSVINTLAEEYNDLERGNDAMENVREAFAIEESMLASAKGTIPAGLQRERARSFNTLACIYLKKLSYSLALDNHLRALEISKLINDTVGIARCYNYMGLVYHEKWDYANAMHNYFESLKWAEQAHDSSAMAIALNNIGLVQGEQGNNDKALEYHKRALKMEELRHNTKGVSKALNNIGIFYLNNEDYNMALDYFTRSLKLDEAANDLEGISDSYNNLALVYDGLGDKKRSIEYDLVSMEVDVKRNDKKGVTVSLTNLGCTFLAMGDHKKALDYGLRALALSKETGAISNIGEAELLLSDVYSAMGKNDLALRHYKNHVAARDSIFNLESSTKSIAAELDFEFQKKAAVAKAEHEKEVIALEAESNLQKSTRNFVVAIAAMIIVVIILAFVYYNSRKSLRMRKQYARQLLQSQESERQRISKELHDSIGQNILFIRNQLVKSNSDLLPSIDETLSEVRSISKDLYPNQLEKYGLVAAVDALAEKVKDSSGIFVSHDLEAFNRDIAADKQIQYYRIIQECITNTLKHAEASALRITATSMNGSTELVVQDNGKGFDKQTLTGKAQHSFGMLNLEERTRFLGGKFELESSPGNGTKYKFSLPA
jgi:signal transduction histidine kinase/Tfp pilus assembly protein PilF